MMEIRNHLDLFYKLVEGIARLDVLQSLAEASSGNCYVCPRFSDYTEVLNAKHPMLDVLCSKEPIANPIVTTIQRFFVVLQSACCSEPVTSTICT